MLQNALATLLFFLVQFGAMWYYSLSFIPGAQRGFKWCMGKLLA